MRKSKMDNCRKTCKMQKPQYLVHEKDFAHRYGDDISKRLQGCQTRLRSLHNAVYIIYVHNQQNFTKSRKSVEIQGFLRYSMYRRKENVGFFEKNRTICGLHHCETQDIVFHKTEPIPS